MTTEELKAHRRAICEALIEGKQCQIRVFDEWCDHDADSIAANLFRSPSRIHSIRIKPEPRKVWIGWPEPGKSGWKDYCIRPAELKREDLGVGYNWQLVEEPE